MISLKRNISNSLSDDFTQEELLKAEREWMFRGKLKLVSLEKPPVWLVMGGRGAGKTRLGAEWVHALVYGYSTFSDDKYSPIALIGETIADVRDVMIEGPAGIKKSIRTNRPRFYASKRQLVWENGAIAQVFSSEDPESLRGPQFAAAWCDEIGKWKNAVETWDMLQFGLRLGSHPRVVATTTPRPTKLMKRLIGDGEVVKTIVTTRENEANLAPGFVNAITAQYGGSDLGRQELDGELIEDDKNAMWKRDELEQCHGVRPQELNRIIIAVDPPATSGKNSASCGIVAAGLDDDGIGWVLADRTLSSATPQQWARRAVALYHELKADRIIAETNQGGEMVVAVIRQIDANVPVKAVHASRGKRARAEPVSALYTQHKVRHAGRFAELEDEMCNFTVDGLSGGRSPDRLDALVWALTELMLKDDGEPRVRGLG
jgi:phage terminase large subunit-like protein